MCAGSQENPTDFRDVRDAESLSVESHAGAAIVKKSACEGRLNEMALFTRSRRSSIIEMGNDRHPVFADRRFKHVHPAQRLVWCGVAHPCQ